MVRINQNLTPCGCFVPIDGARRYIPLIKVDAHTTILATTSRTTLTQTFENANKSESLKELRYVFPLYDGVAVASFKCTIGDRVIRGTVQERRKAKLTYDQAIAQGQTAGLLEQNLDASDVFTTTIGNVPAGEKVKVDITYLGELKYDAEIDGVRFTIPTAIAPRYGSSQIRESSQLQGQGFSVTVDVDMPNGCTVKSIQSPSHPISVNIGTVSTTSPSEDPSLQKASASLAQESVELDADFVIQITANKLGDPSAVLETHPTLANQRALMTTLVPKFALPPQKPEIVFVCDRSGSMGSGKRIPHLKAALNIFLKSLPVGVRFNICSFGSHHEFLFKKSQPYNQHTLDEAVRYVVAFKANFGGTEMYVPMQQTIMQRHRDMNLEVFLLTDGEIWNQNDLFGLINDSVDQAAKGIRVFTLGIGNDVSHVLVEGVARAGNAFSQVVGDGEKMDKKVVRMLKAALTPHVNDYTLEIKYVAPTRNEGDEDEEFEIIDKIEDALDMIVVNQVTVGAGGAPQKPISLFQADLKEEEGARIDVSTSDAKDDLPDIPCPKYLQTPWRIPPLFPFNRTNIYILLSDDTPSRSPSSVILRGTSAHGPLELEIPITIRSEKSTTIHQLAAKKACQELEEGRGWIFHAKAAESGSLLKDHFESRFCDFVERESVRLGVTFQIAGKWTSYVAVEDTGTGAEGVKVPIEDLSPSFPAATFALRADKRMVGAPRAGIGGGNIMNRSATFALASFGGTFGSATPPPPPSGLSAPAPQAMYGSFSACAQMPDEDESDSEDQGFGAFDVPSPVTSNRKEPRIQTESFNARLKSLNATRGATTTKFGSSRSRSQPATDPLQDIIGLQTFSGSWSWTKKLESLLSVTKSQAAEAAGCRVNDDVLATVVVLIFLKTKFRDEEESWDMLVAKAEDWAREATGNDQLTQLTKALEGLF